MKPFVIIISIFLVLTLPFTTVAQTSDAAQAEIDANRDAKHRARLGIRCLTGVASVGLCFGGLFWGVSIANDLPIGDHIFLSREQTCAIFCLPVIGSLIPSISMPLAFPPKSPPPERLLGKSPEYVYTYTRAYKKRVAILEILATNFGQILGCITSLAVIYSLEEEIELLIQ